MISVTVYICTVVGMLLPSFGLIFSVVWSLLFHFRSSVGTACRAVNFLPTVSSAIGLKPQMYVWRLSIALHVGLRLVLASSYYHWHLREALHYPTQRYKMLVQFAVGCHVIENLGLLTLTVISSTDNGDIHEYSFVAFMVCSQVYMILSCCLIYWTHRQCWMKVTTADTHMLKKKVALWMFNLFVMLLSIYLYFRHNAYCEPYVYSWFALAEYLFIFSNIAFHYQAAHDFGGYRLSILTTEDVSSIGLKNRSMYAESTQRLL